MPPHTYDHSAPNIHNLLSSLTPHNIPHTLDLSTREGKSNTPWSPAPPTHTPLIVFFPQTTLETSTILRACNERRIAVTPFSGGTSFGQALGNSEGGVCVSFEKMDRVVKVNEEDMDVVVQPGLGWVELNERLEEKGLFFPVDPAPGARVGGMIAMSCSGTNAYAYGTMASNVISLTLVLASGIIIKTHHRPRKTSAGYDLTHLVIGSEGTLALVTEAVLRLAPIPRNLHVGLATFKTFQEGLDVVVSLQKLGHRLEALELADGPQMTCVNVSGLAPARMFEEVPTLFFKIAGPSVRIVQDQISVVQELCKKHGASNVEITHQQDEMDVIWGARKCMGTALLAMKKQPTDLFLHSDCAVPISNLSRLVAGTQDLIAKASKRAFEDQISTTSVQRETSTTTPPPPLRLPAASPTHPARKCMGTALLAMKKKDTDLFLHSDCAVPISNLSRLVAGTQDLISQASTANQATWFCANVGHIGDGNVHSSIVCPQEHYDAAMSVIMDIARLALSLEGTVTGEHGIGMKLRDALEEEVGSEGVEVMRAVKRSLDPRGILNPGKVFRLVKEGKGEEGKSKL